jgi:hypothetical protein
MTVVDIEWHVTCTLVSYTLGGGGGKVMSQRMFAAGLVVVVCLSANRPFAGPVAAANARDDSAAVAREEFLESEAWKETMQSWNAWLESQKLYDRRQVKRMKQSLGDRVERASLDELETIQDELRAKLDILNGPQATNARRWLNDTLAVASDKYAKQVRARMPDVANLSPGELRAAFNQFAERLTQTREGEAEILQARHDRLLVVQSELRQQHSDVERAVEWAGRNVNAGAGRNFVPQTIHNRQTFSQRHRAGVGWGIGFW